VVTDPREFELNARNFLGDKQLAGQTLTTQNRVVENPYFEIHAGIRNTSTTSKLYDSRTCWRLSNQAARVSVQFSSNMCIAYKFAFGVAKTSLVSILLYWHKIETQLAMYLDRIGKLHDMLVYFADRCRKRID